MTDIINMKIRRLDGLSLLVFQTLLRERKATVAAAALGVTQSSISHTLRRLRDITGDPLFLRLPHGLAPTATALALAPMVDSALDAMRSAVGGVSPFDAANSDWVVRVTAAENLLTTLVPALAARMAREAPRMRLVAAAKVRGEALAALTAGEVDLSLGLHPRLSSEFVAEPLFEETYLVAGAPDHLWFKAGCALPEFIEATHVVTSVAGDLWGVVDRALEARGLKRQVVAAAPMFLSAFALASALGALVTAPRRVVEAHAARFRLISAPPPVAIRPFTVSAVRHRRDARNPALDWLVARVKSSSTESEPDFAGFDALTRTHEVGGRP